MASGLPSRSRHLLPWGGLVVLALGLVGYVVWRFYDRPAAKEPDMVAVLRHKTETDVLEVFERLSGGGMRFRRLLLRLIASQLRFRRGSSI